MKLISIAAILALSAAPAFAWNTPQKNPHAAAFASSHSKNTNIAKGGKASAKATATGGKASAKQRQGQAQNQTQRQSSHQSQANGQSTTVGGDTYEASAYAPSMYGDSTAPCVKSTSLSFGTIGATGGLSLPQESKNCWTERRAEQVAGLSSACRAGDGGACDGLIYLAGQDPTACTIAARLHLVVCAPRGNPFNQTQNARIH